MIHCVDDILVDSTDTSALGDFIHKMSEKFDIECRPRADWCLQTRLQQDKDKNISLDQTRCCRSMIQRFLPMLANQEPTQAEIKKHQSPVKTEVILTEDDNSKDKEEVKQLEEEFSFKCLELIGCFDWLSCTCCEEIFCTR